MPNAVVYGLKIELLKMDSSMIDMVWDRLHPDPTASLGPSVLQVTTKDMLDIFSEAIKDFSTDIQLAIRAGAFDDFNIRACALDVTIHAVCALLLHSNTLWLIDSSIP